MLIPEKRLVSGFDVIRVLFRCLIGGSLAFVSLIHTCRGLPRLLTVTFTTATFRTEAAYGCLKPAPTNRLRRAYLHLGYSIVLNEHVLGTKPPTEPCVNLSIYTARLSHSLVASRPQNDAESKCSSQFPSWQKLSLS